MPESESVEYIHLDSSGRMWDFTVYEATGGWFFEVSAASPHHPQASGIGPFLVAEHAMRAT
jgi:hypothetical protein